MNQNHELERVDANLLVALDALLAERSVTRAAKRVGVTQSAMSHTLRRLRELLDDPVLVRVGARMEPTPRAEGLQAPLREHLDGLGRLLRAPRFDPASSDRGFSMVAPDLFDVLVLPRLVATLREQAPGVSLSVGSFAASGLVEALVAGELDLAVLATPQFADRTDLVARVLLRDTFSCFLREDHPALGAWGVDAYAEAAHAIVAPRLSGPSPVDTALAAVGRSRRVVLRLPSFTAAPAHIGGSDLVLTAPTMLEQVLPRGLVRRDLPVAVPSHGVAAVWHPRFTADPGHRWFREQLVRAARPG